jgi:hypothetical protein
MPMNKQTIGKDKDGKDVVMVWGADLNWAHGFVEGPEYQKREYYRAQGKGDASYVVARDVAKKCDEKGYPIYNYWCAIVYIDGKTEHLPTEFMSAYEGQEVCQIFESERDARGIHAREHTRELDKERARIESKKDD